MLADHGLHVQVLPDVKGWEYKGSYEVNGQAAELWELEQRWGPAVISQHSLYSLVVSRMQCHSL